MGTSVLASGLGGRLGLGSRREKSGSVRLSLKRDKNRKREGGGDEINNYLK